LYNKLTWLAKKPTVYPVYAQAKKKIAHGDPVINELSNGY